MWPCRVRHGKLMLPQNKTTEHAAKGAPRGMGGIEILPFETPARFLRLGGSCDDTCEIGGLEGGTADETAVDILLCEELGGVAGLH